MRALYWLILAMSPPAEANPPDTVGERAQVQVHLTIDDLPWMVERGHSIPASSHEIREQNKALEAILAEHQVKVSVFFTCERIRPEDGSVKIWLGGGHTVGNHTWSHPKLDKVGAGVWVADAKKCHDILAQYMDTAPTWLRYPYLGYGQDREQRDDVTTRLAAFGERTAPVTIATTEWLFAYTYRRAKRTGDQELERLVVAEWHQHMDAALQRGVDSAAQVPGRNVPQTVLLHMNELVIDEIGHLITRWKGKNIVFIDLEAAMADPVFQMENRYTGPAGVSWLRRIRDRSDWGEYWFGLEEGRVQERFGAIDPADKGVPQQSQ